MRWLQKATHRLRSMFRKSTVEQELGSELHFHLERQVQENVSAGMTPQEARRAAMREFGGVEQVKEECRDTRRVNFLENILGDIRYGLRMLRKSPSFTFFAVAVLALGIAANSAIFSIADAVLIRPLPYAGPNQLAMAWEDASAYGFPKNTPAPGNFSDWKSRNQVFTDVAATSSDEAFNLTGQGTPEKLTGREVTANLFSLLGVTPERGRDFRLEDDVAGATPVVILSHGLWLRRFGGDPEILGKEISLNYEKYIVIGVMKRGFQFSDREAELWVTERFTKEQLANHDSHFLEVVARLKQDVSLKTANADLAIIARQIEKEHPGSNAKVGAFAVPLREEIAGDVRPAILMLVGAVCFVLLIACANVANLLLSRATGRRREMAMRLALGATRGRIVQQMLTESALLAFFAGLAGLLLSVWGTRFLATLIPAGIAPLTGTGVDGRVLLFTLAVTLATGILFGIIPASRVSQFHLTPSLKQGGGQSGVGSGGQHLRDALVICEVALAIVLLAGGALMIRSLQNLYHLDPGFRADHVLVAHSPLPSQKYKDLTQRTAFYDQVLANVERLRGVVAAGFTTWVPLTNAGGAMGVTLEGKPEPVPGEAHIPNVRIISKDYPAALGMKLIDGRLFDRGDGFGKPYVALINQTMARNYWPGESPLGQRFKTGAYAEKSPWITVVGIVGDIHQAGLDLPARAEMYFPYQQQDDGFSPEYLAVRSSGDPMALTEAVRQQVWAVDKEQPVTEVMPLEDFVDDNLAARKMQASLLSGFAALALLLVTLGIYAVLSFAVTQRTQEIGVRVALGAQPRDVLRMIFSQGFKLFLIGAAIGLAAAFALARALVHLLFGVSAYDPASFVSVTLLLAAVALLACYVPARRATRVDPLVALRYE
jgi:putative ABC transport system permease protein